MTPDQPEQVGALAYGIAMRLMSGARGLSLVGPQRSCDQIVARLLQDLHPSQLLPVHIRADSSSPDLLREAARSAHAGRLARDTALLLVVADAGALSAGMLRELDQAAEAAISPGGLKLLLCSAASLSTTLRDAELSHLLQCLETELAIPAPAPQPGGTVTAATPAMAAQAPIAPQRGSQLQRTKPPPRRRRFGLLVLGAVALAALLLAVLVWPTNPPSPVPSTSPPTQPATQAPVSRPLVPAPVGPAPALPAPPPPAPTLPAPALPAPAVPAPAPPAPTVPVTVPPRAADGSGSPPAPAPGSDTTGAPGASPLLLVAQPGDTLPVLYAKVYAGNTPPPYPQVVSLNPVVVPGTRLIFPAPPGGWRSRP